MEERDENKSNPRRHAALSKTLIMGRELDASFQ